MRHRITSFRCVEAEEKMSFIVGKRKTCTCVKFRQTLWLRAAQARQSSITCAASAQAGTTSAGPPDTLTPKRPRLKAIASSSGSVATTSALRRWVAGLKLAGRLRVCALVQTLRNGAAPVAGLEMMIRRVAATQRIVSCGSAEALRNDASLPLDVTE